MPRVARRKSETGIYHVMLRGINYQVIFEDDEDYLRMLETIDKYREKSGYILYAYCLMGNHLHLLMREVTDDLGIIFRRIGASYVHWYNSKYKRRGHLFQGRYRSEVVENDNSFRTVLRYIHQNPLKAGIVENIVDYRWSSYGEYVGQSKICDTDFALEMFSADRGKALEQFVEFNLAENQDQCLDYDDYVRLNDIEAAEYIRGISNVDSPTEIGGFEKERRNEVIRMCKKMGLSYRQIQRLTGVSFGVIRRI